METIHSTLTNLKSLILKNGTGISVVKLRETQNLSKLETQTLMMNGNMDDPFSSSLNSEIEKERNRLINEFEGYFLSEQPNQKPVDVYEKINNYQIQMERLSVIIEPTVGKVLFTSNNTQYDMAKIVWINDEGKKIRISRTVGQSNQKGLLHPLQKYIEDVVRVEEEFYLSKSSNGYVFDLVVKVDGELFGLGLQHSKKDEFLISVARVDLWRQYKKIYLE